MLRGRSNYSKGQSNWRKLALDPMIATTPPPSLTPVIGEGQTLGGPYTLELLVARLKSAGLKVTAPRIAILQVLSRSTQPSTIEQIFLNAGNSACDLVTIYRSMAAFEKAGVVYRSGFSERGAVLYNAEIGD